MEEKREEKRWTKNSVIIMGVMMPQRWLRAKG